MHYIKTQNFVMQCTRKGHVRGIYALKRIIHTPKAHGAQKPRQYVIVRRGYEHRATQQGTQKMCLERCNHVG